MRPSFNKTITSGREKVKFLSSIHGILKKRIFSAQQQSEYDKKVSFQTCIFVFLTSILDPRQRIKLKKALLLHQKPNIIAKSPLTGKEPGIFCVQQCFLLVLCYLAMECSEMIDVFNWHVETIVFNWDDGTELFIAFFHTHSWSYVYNDGNYRNYSQVIRGFLTHAVSKAGLRLSRNSTQSYEGRPTSEYEFHTEL
jgi:hypothetical protein